MHKPSTPKGAARRLPRPQIVVERLQQRFSFAQTFRIGAFRLLDERAFAVAIVGGYAGGIDKAEAVRKCIKSESGRVGIQ